MTRRLLAAYLALTVLVLAALEIPLGITYARNERRDLEARVERDALAVGSVAEGALESPPETSIASVRALVARYARDTGGRVTVVDVRGQSLADSSGRAGRDFSSRPEVAAALAGRVATGTRRSETLRTTLLYVAVPVASSGHVVGAVRITYPMSALDRRVGRYWGMLGAIAAVVLAGAVLAGVFLARSVTRPLRRLEGAAEEIGTGRLDVRAPEQDGPPEIRSLSRVFNRTAATLEQLVSAQREFVADASHELRTPLTALRLRLENLDPEAAGPALAEAERLGRVVEGLLSLARADAGGARVESVAVDRVLDERLATWAGVTRAGQRGLLVRSSPDRLGQIVDNLLANAVAVSDSVTVSAVADDGWVELRVADRGPGLTAEERARAFDRFWSKRAGGSGLGLAIVRRLAEVDGGEARLDEAAGGGVDAVVRLRRA